jgi:hypothetical protein
MTTDTTSDSYLARAEEILRDAEYDLPVAWAIGFLLDNENLLTGLLRDNNHVDKAESVEGICDWIINGDPCNREDEDEEDLLDQAEDREDD